MLLLSRRIGQELVIADNIRIRIVRSSGGRVTVGIEAPRDLAIRRVEAEDASAPTEIPAIPPLKIVRVPPAMEPSHSSHS